MGKAISTEAQIAGELVATQTAITASLKGLMLPGESYDLDFFASKIHAAENQAQFALLEIGRLFKIMQVSEGNEFAGACERVGRTVSYGYRMAALHDKMGSGERAKLLTLGSSKAMEFLAFDSEELDRIANNQVAGITLDDIDRMTVQKLRDTLRKARIAAKDAQDVQDQLVEGRDKRIKELQRAAKLGDKYDGFAAELLGDIARESATISAAARTLIERVGQFGQLDNVTDDQLKMVQDLVNNTLIATSELNGLVG
jgi:hypothetical protein